MSLGYKVFRDQPGFKAHKALREQEHKGQLVPKLHKVHKVQRVLKDLDPKGHRDPLELGVKVPKAPQAHQVLEPKVPRVHKAPPAPRDQEPGA